MPEKDIDHGNELMIIYIDSVDRRRRVYVCGLLVLTTLFDERAELILLQEEYPSADGSLSRPQRFRRSSQSAGAEARSNWVSP
jgi:hypothetical protein